MSQLLPPSFLFRYSFAVRYEAALPHRGTKLLELAKVHSLPDLGALDGRQAQADIRLAWNERGVGICAVMKLEQRGATQPVRTPDRQLEVWIDTRCTQNVHRATRYCHHFGLFPSGGGVGGTQPMVRQYSIARAREEAPRCDLSEIVLASRERSKGYELEAWLPIATLNGFDPEASPRLGFFYRLSSADAGEQLLALSNEFPISNDPSQWVGLELVR